MNIILKSLAITALVMALIIIFIVGLFTTKWVAPIIIFLVLFGALFCIVYPIVDGW